MMALRVATYNIHRCIGRDGQARPERIAGVLREIDADIIALQEVAVQPGSHRNVLASLAEAAGAIPIQGFTLSEKRGLYGNALLSRIPLSAVDRMDISVAGREPRGVIEAVFEVDRCRCLLLATHLGLTAPERRYQTGHLINRLDDTPADVKILAGDFNEWFFGGRPLRRLKRWFGAHRSPPTFPSRHPILGLDRIWVSPVDRMSSLNVHATPLSRLASDHLPLVAEVHA